jgi:hypothetical protein
MAPDWLAAVDTLLREDIRLCTLCGQRDPRGWVDVLDVGGLGVAILRCLQCYGRPGSLQEVQQVLARRYGRPG